MIPIGKIAMMLVTSALAGCSLLTPMGDYCTPSHSCPKPGHGPCYLCDAPEKDGSSNYYVVPEVR